MLWANTFSTVCDAVPVLGRLAVSLEPDVQSGGSAPRASGCILRSRGKQSRQLEKSTDPLSPNSAMAKPASITTAPTNFTGDIGLSNAPINPK